MRKEVQSDIILIGAILIGLVLFISVIWGCFALHSIYSVWSKGKEGEAILKQAEWTRRVAVTEAQAKLDSASLLAKSEIARAEGVAAANKIIGDSLKGNEAYLRYLWIDSLQHTQDKIIYVPTEAGLPMLEAGKR